MWDILIISRSRRYLSLDCHSHTYNESRHHDLPYSLPLPCHRRHTFFYSKVRSIVTIPITLHPPLPEPPWNHSSPLYHEIFKEKYYDGLLFFLFLQKSVFMDGLKSRTQSLPNPSSRYSKQINAMAQISSIPISVLPSHLS
jgi:hypothetical protein